LGMVNCPPDFAEQPSVINGASELIIALWGEERGAHTRAAVGMGSLPGQIPVEIEAMVEIE
ncbi:MAG: RidA family protein, partial [Chloroflexota bacterium]